MKTAISTLKIADAQLELIKTGISQTIAPYVSEDGYITLEVEPEESEVVARRGVYELPITNKRNVSTKVRIASEKTVVIGGMVLNENTTIVKKTLYSIPILGRFFDIPINKLNRVKSQS